MPKINKVLSKVKAQAELGVKKGFTPLVTSALYKDSCSPDCEICKGQSYVRGDYELGHPKFGRLFPCPNLPIISSKHNFDTGLSGRDRTHTFEEILQRENVTEAITAVVELLNKRRGMLLLYGGYGLGKTLLLKIAVTMVVQANDLRFARYRLMPVILNEMRDTFKDDGNLVEVQKEYSKFDLLCIDELGVAKDTPFVSEQQFMLINERYEAAIEREEEIMTIIATNLPLSELPPRLVDRFMDARCKAVELTGDSFRPLQK